MARRWTTWEDIFARGRVDVSPRLRRRLDELQSRFDAAGAEYYEAVHALVALEGLVSEGQYLAHQGLGRQEMIDITVGQALDAGCTPDDIDIALGRDGG